MNEVVKICIAGCMGRMGQSLIKLAEDMPDVEVTAAFTHPEDPAINQTLNQAMAVSSLVVINDSLSACANDFDVLIDFTKPEVTLENVKQCEAAGKAIVIGTTGITAEQRAYFAQASKNIPLLWAPNTSIGINLCYELLAQVAAVIGEQADIEISEKHHKHKIDAPSGAALKMGEVIADTLKRDLAEVGVFERHGRTGTRPDKAIGFSALRAGSIIGEHTALFALENETIEITHKAQDRSIFAKGGLEAAKWLHNKKPGFYAMKDVIGFKQSREKM